MTRDDIIGMAREAWGDDSGKPWHESALVHLEAFAKLVAAAEREACAVIAFNAKTYIEAAKAIRARGQE